MPAGTAVIVRGSALGKLAKGEDVGFQLTLKEEGRSLVTWQLARISFHI